MTTAGRSSFLLLFAFVLGTAAMWALMPRAACSQSGCPPEAAPKIPEATLTPIAFADIPGWAEDDHAAALGAFKVSCAAIAANPARFDRPGNLGSLAAWARVCAAALNTAASEARRFFEASFEPVAASDGAARDGKVTGYYEPELRGSRTKSAAFPAPVYARPTDLVTADPVGFRAVLRGERLSGKVVDAVLMPYETRAEIEAGALSGRARPIVYLPATADAFFLQIQGSGRVVLDEGGALRVGYAAQNGHKYTAIGAALIERGAIARKDMSMQAIRAWLAANPDEASAVMNLNESYVFFEESPLDDPAIGPKGGEGVPLTPGRSLAVDARIYPYGVPVFVTATVKTPAGADESLRRLMIAQDTGGAIRGVVRGDIFFGWGADAEAQAGATDGTARFVLLRPKGA